MRHFQVTLERQDRSVRQWSLWADTLTVGSHPLCTLVMPSPVAAHAGAFSHDGTLDLPVGRLLVHDDTEIQQSLWAKARERIALSRRLEWREPGTRDKARSIALSALSLFGLLGMIGMHVVGQNPPKVADGAIPTDYLVVPVDVIPPPPPPPPAPQERDRALKPEERQRTDPNPTPPGGSTETRTIQASTNTTPAAVMARSVMDYANTASDGLIGEMVDPNQSNLIDVILAGGGGSTTRGRGGRGAAGDGDRMAALGNIGLGNGGRDGVGRGRNGALRGPTTAGGGAFVPTRAIVKPPRPDEVVLGGEAGTRSPESILRVIRSAVGGFQYTYQKYLKKNDALGGKVSLKFTIAPSGDIIAINVVASNTGDGELDAEIMDKARRMKFDTIERGNVTVTYAFVLDKQ